MFCKIACTLVSAAGFLGAQQAADIWAGVYSSEQARLGRAVFEKSCSNCHNQDLKGNVRGPALRGDGFLANWFNSSLNTLYSKLRFSMPATYPESVSDSDKLLVLAFLLEANGFPAGASELKPEEEILEAIQIVKQGSKELANFTLVRVTGCLEAGPNRSWTLQRASDPVAAREGDTAAGARSLGSKSFILVSAGGFAPESHRGEKVEIHGLLYMEPGENRLNVTRLEREAQVCPD
jgi:quinoprotein glucose dehydrogenase